MDRHPPAPTESAAPGSGPTRPVPARQRVFVLGASGTIGLATARALLRQGHEVVCWVRPRAGAGGQLTQADMQRLLPGATMRVGDVQDAAALARDGFCGEHFDSWVSCLASRNGEPKDAWAIDHDAHVQTLAAARRAGVRHVVLLSAICVQKPLLAFQRAKLAFEQQLIESGLTYSIVRPTAFFKSLSGQIERVKQGKPYLVFGDGRLTACKPVDDNELGDYLAGCLTEPERHNRILPIGGPGEALTPLQQGELLFQLLGQPPKFKHVPVRLLDLIVGTLSGAGRFLPSLAAKAELARIGRYYATESMLVWDAAAGHYDAAATPSTGSRTLAHHFADVLNGRVCVDRGDHAVF